MPSSGDAPDDGASEGDLRLSPLPDEPGAHRYTVQVAGRTVGEVCLVEVGPGHARASWTLESGVDPAPVLLLLFEHGFATLGLDRVQALVDPDDDTALRTASRAGLRREGVLRGHRRLDDGRRRDRVVLARLATDVAPGEPAGFRALLNAFLPRKRAIAQMLVRDRASRVLLCRLTYKPDWDLPGGVVEVGESPRSGVTREVAEELALDLPAGPLLLTDWLPPWSGWEDALCLVFDGGTHDASIRDRAVLEAREIASVRFCTPAEVREHCADFTARRVEAALAALDGRNGASRPAFTESGRG